MGPHNSAALPLARRGKGRTVVLEDCVRYSACLAQVPGRGKKMAGKSAGGHARSARTGQYVTPVAAARNPRTTVTESGANNSSGTHSRSAISGRFVTPATARRHPDTTITEKG
jgi:hypothetical protein